MTPDGISTYYDEGGTKYKFEIIHGKIMKTTWYPAYYIHVEFYTSKTRGFQSQPNPSSY